jgi:hypothetical protein
MCSYFNKGGPDRTDTILLSTTIRWSRTLLRLLKLLFHMVQTSTLDGPHQRHFAERKERTSESLSSTDPLTGVAGGGIGQEPKPNLQRCRTVLRLVWTVRSWRSRIMQDFVSGNTFRFLLLQPWQKALAEHLSAIWDDSVVALRTATRVIILGYSIPPTDQHFRYLLAAGLQDNISLRKVFFVNPALGKEQMKNQLENRLMGLFRSEHFERGIIEPVSTDIRDFLGGPRNFGEGSYRVGFGRPLNPAGFTMGTAPWTFYPPFLQGWSIE